MTSPSNKDRDMDTPQGRLDRLLMALANKIVQMKETLSKEHNIPADQVNEAHSIMGELAWTSGAVEGVLTCLAADEQPKIEVIH